MRDRGFLRLLWTVCLVVSVAGCAAEAPETASEDLWTQAQRLAQEGVIVDTHVDVPYRLKGAMEDISQSTEDGDFDYPRAVEGGLNVPFMSIYVPAAHQETGDAREVAEELVAMVRGFEAQWPEKFAVATTVAEVREQFEKGVISLPMGMENGAGLEDDLGNVEHFHQLGIRYITLTHGENNLIGDSSYATERQWNGLSPFGREVVAEMNRLGIMVDISHVSDETFYQVLEVTEAPVIASHSSCRRFTPGFERNMDDDMIRALADNGGVIGINFGSSFLLQEANENGMARWQAIGAYQEEHGLDEGDPRLEEFERAYREEHPPVFADISDVVAHIDHVVDLVGIDHVGIGSDFDGVGDSLPTGLKDVAAFPNLIYELLKRGYSEEDVRKILGENLLRVWSEVERTAAARQAAG